MIRTKAFPILLFEISATEIFHIICCFSKKRCTWKDNTMCSKNAFKKKLKKSLIIFIEAECGQLRVYRFFELYILLFQIYEYAKLTISCFYTTFFIIFCSNDLVITWISFQNAVKIMCSSWLCDSCFKLFCFSQMYLLPEVLIKLVSI